MRQHIDAVRLRGSSNPLCLGQPAGPVEIGSGVVCNVLLNVRSAIPLARELLTNSEWNLSHLAQPLVGGRTLIWNQLFEEKSVEIIRAPTKVGRRRWR